jgi:DNA-binding transcriptional regulator of glucitol operon
LLVTIIVVLLPITKSTLKTKEMEENQPKTGKFALTYGLILGGISVIYAFMLYTMDMHYQGGAAVMLISIGLMIAAVIIGMMQFKKANNGFMSFGQALKVGVGICLISGIIGVIFNQILANVIDPEMMSKAIEYQRGQLMEGTALSPEQIDAQIEMGQKFSTPSMQVLFGLIFSVVLGFIVSLIPALVLKKQEVLD